MATRLLLLCLNLVVAVGPGWSRRQGSLIVCCNGRGGQEDGASTHQLLPRPDCPRKHFLRENTPSLSCAMMLLTYEPTRAPGAGVIAHRT